MSDRLCRHCLDGIPPHINGGFCSLRCAALGERAWSQAQIDAKAREAAARQAAAPTSPLEPGGVAEAVNDTLEKVGTVARGLFDFLTADSTESFVRKIDAKHGTNLEGAINTHAPGAMSALDGVREASPLTSGPASTTEPAARVAGDPEGVNVLHENDRAVVIEMPKAEAPACAFCKGRVVLAMNPSTGERVAVACPKCKAPPKSTPRLTG